MKKPLLLSAIALSSLMLNSCFLDPALELMKGEEKSSEQAQTLIEDMTKKVLDPKFEKKQVFKVSFSGVFKEKEETRSGSGSMIVNLKDSVINMETNNTEKKGNTETKSHEKQEIYIKDNVLYTVDLEEKTYTTNSTLPLATFNMQWQMSLLFTDVPYTYNLAENVIENDYETEVYRSLGDGKLYVRGEKKDGNLIKVEYTDYTILSSEVKAVEKDDSIEFKADFSYGDFTTTISDLKGFELED